MQIPGMTPEMVSHAQTLMTKHPQMVQMMGAMPPEQVVATVQGMLSMPQEQQEQYAQMMGIPPQMLQMAAGMCAD
jgi:hypothetical protein